MTTQISPVKPFVANGTSHSNGLSHDHQDLVDYIKLKLTVAGSKLESDDPATRLKIPFEVLAHLKERIRHSYGNHAPIDQRVQSFLDSFMATVEREDKITLPGLGQSFILDRIGMATELSIPEGEDLFESDIVKSYKLMNGQGVLHNPKSDRRTTQGVFHVAEGGLPIPEDKLAVPTTVFANILAAALNPPAELSRLPFTAHTAKPVETFVSLLLRPIVVPEIPGLSPEKRAEIKFLAPGNLVGNLDFVERIFGNAGDPHLPQNDAALDGEHWTGTSGYILLAPHLITKKKAELGLPNVKDATDRQKKDGMCWTSEDELYNGGNAFKICARDSRGIMFTIIADNYFGYCKKEVKTQISYAANLIGYAEEEHAGGAQVFPQYDLGKVFSVPTHLPKTDHTFAQVLELFGSDLDLKPDGSATDRRYPDLVFVPEDVVIDLDTQSVTWTNADGKQVDAINPRFTYIVPSGFKVRLEAEEASGQWRLVGTASESTFCHKPSTVSGGGKSEISKPITDAIMYGPFFIADFDRDMDYVETLLKKDDYGKRFKARSSSDSRPVLSETRSLGSVIKLLTPSSTLYTDEYNAWLESIPNPIRQLAFIVKRFYRPEMGENWRSSFSVDVVNGRPGNELKFNDEKIITHYMRVGFTDDGKWRIYSLRDDFVPAHKLQREDDITASMVVPVGSLPGTNPKYNGPVSFKVVSKENPERCLFQRPDDAIHRGYDKATEAHFALNNNFFSNYAPLTAEDAQKILSAPVTFSQYTAPMQNVIRKAAQGHGYFVASSHPRIVDGKPTKNPRYLQIRPDLMDPKSEYLGELSARVHRKIPTSLPIPTPVNAVLPGRRLNPPEPAASIRSLAAYNPIHFQETPELFMEYISSLTGKSPSTTGAGSEGALTKGPFNAVLPVVDINNALVSHLLTSSECFVTAAGFVGPQFRVDHDISLLIPEIWSRMEVSERSAAHLIANNYLEPLEDFDHEGRKVLASRLGYRITPDFVRTFFGIVFDNPNDVFTPEMLRPELTDMDVFIDGIDNIVQTQKQIAEYYFEDGSINFACPPIKALLHVMRDGHFEGKDANDPEFRALFTLDSLLTSDWYQERLHTQRIIDAKHIEQEITYLNKAAAKTANIGTDVRAALHARIQQAEVKRAQIASPDYISTLQGYIGADPSIL
jgi:hypothetical protein